MGFFSLSSFTFFRGVATDNQYIVFSIFGNNVRLPLATRKHFCSAAQLFLIEPHHLEKLRILRGRNKGFFFCFDRRQYFKLSLQTSDKTAGRKTFHNDLGLRWTNLGKLPNSTGLPPNFIIGYTATYFFWQGV